MSKKEHVKPLLKPVAISLVLFFMAGALAACDTDSSPYSETSHNEWGKAERDIDGQSYSLSVADTPAKLQRGYMNVTSVKKGEGILFEFSSEEKHCMWMKNTLIPLTVIFFDSEWNELNRVNMKPLDLAPKCSSGQAKYAVEIPLF